MTPAQALVGLQSKRIGSRSDYWSLWLIGSDIVVVCAEFIVSARRATGDVEVGVAERDVRFVSGTRRTVASGLG